MQNNVEKLLWPKAACNSNRSDLPVEEQGDTNLVIGGFPVTAEEHN